jgi:Asp-tRNA(Asn)/Glu-tRNA(Gln) amidotransferase A subunit family amidase
MRAEEGMAAMDPADLGAFDARSRMARGELRAAEYVEAQLRRIAARDADVEAFAFFDPALPRGAAKAVDEYRASGRPIGALHGLTVGLKDIIDTADMPTENGTRIDAGRRPGKDATIVRRLREAGAIVMGKTVTTELAYASPGKTRNPHDPGRTPGGSSSGSAAAVAAGMVSFAVGTQTFGSVIRPASFCGVVGLKPTHGLIPRTGIRLLVGPLDTVGVFARSVVDAAMIADVLAGHDPLDEDTRLMPPPGLLEVALTDPPVLPDLAFVKSPVWEQAEPETQRGFQELVEALGERCTEVALPEIFGEWQGAHRALMQSGMARNLGPYYRKAKDQLSAPMRSIIEDGLEVTAVDYLAALDWREALNNGLDQLFERFDAIVTPAAPGEAPRGLEATGNPIFNGLWTLCGVPAVTLPLMAGPNGMPVGVQMVGRRGEDAKLMRTARWLANLVENSA